MMVCKPFSIFISLLAFTGTIGSLTVLFAFTSNATRHKVLQPLDRIIVSVALVNLLLCCYKEAPAFLSFISTSVFGERGCCILLYAYHMLRLISIWPVENLSFLHVVKIHRWDNHWSKFIYRHQGHYVNSRLTTCWIFSIVFQIPNLRYNAPAKRSTNETAVCLTTSTCLSFPESVITKLTTYVSVGLDLIFITFIIILNGFIIDLLWRQRRKIRAAMGSACNKHTARVGEKLTLVQKVEL